MELQEPYSVSDKPGSERILLIPFVVYLTAFCVWFFGSWADSLVSQSGWGLFEPFRRLIYWPFDWLSWTAIGGVSATWLSLLITLSVVTGAGFRKP